MTPLSPIGPGAILGTQSGQLFSQETADATLLILLKVGFLFGFGMLFLFSLLVIRQISLMNSTLISPLENKIKLVGYSFFVATLVAFILAFVIL